MKTPRPALLALLLLVSLLIPLGLASDSRASVPVEYETVRHIPYECSGPYGCSGIPQGVAVDSIHHRAYVGLGIGLSVAVIDTTTNNPIASLSVPNQYYYGNFTAMAVDPLNQVVYGVDAETGVVLVWNAVTRAFVGYINTGAADALAVDPATRTIYATNPGADAIKVANGSTNSIIKTITSVDCPSAVTIHPATQDLYVASNCGNTVSVIDGDTHAVSGTITVGSNPAGVAVDASTNTVYVTNRGSASVSVVDGTTNTVTHTVAVGKNPRGVTVDPSTQRLYVANGGSSAFSVFDTVTRSLLATVPVTGTPAEIALDTTTHAVVASVQQPIGNNPSSVVFIGKPVRPQITGIAPATGPSGTRVVITGTGFGHVTAVNFGGAGPSPNFTINSDFKITATAPRPDAIAGRHIRLVATNGLTSPLTAADVFTYRPAIEITGISPSSGPTYGGTTVTISGVDPTTVTAVTFGAAGPALQFYYEWGDENPKLMAVSPPSDVVGERHIRVTTTNGSTRATKSDVFTYVRPVPTVTSIAPTSGSRAGGTPVIITGTGFSIGVNKVTFGAAGAASSYTVNSNTQITAVAPPSGALGGRHVRVTTFGGTSTTSPADVFTYTP